MFNDINDITISAGFFEAGTQLQGILSDPFNIVFGRNGSGKSTIANAIAQYASDDPDERAASNIQFNREISDEYRKRIFVFNEQFVRDKVEVEGDGIGSIVMMGESIGQNKRIGELKQIVKKAKEDIPIQEEKAKAAQGAAEELRAKIVKQINDSSDSCYSIRARDARGGKKKTEGDKMIDPINVLRAHQNDILVKNGNISSLLKEVNELVDKLKNIKAGKPIAVKPSLIDYGQIHSAASELLTKVIDRPQLSDREQRILELIQKGEHVLDHTRYYILNPSADICPVCQQPVTPAWRADLSERVKALESQLQDQADAYKQDVFNYLNTLYYTPFDDTPYREAIGVNLVAVCNNCSDTIAKHFETLRDCLEARYANPFESPKDFDWTSFDKAVDKWNDAVAQLSSVIDKYNDAIAEKDNLLSEFEKKNTCLAYLENKDDLASYFQQLKDKGDAEAKIGLDENEIRTSEGELSTLLMGADQDSYACQYINECLSYIFFSKDRLRLEPIPKSEGHSSCYKLLSRGHEVAPDKVSLGERNAIGLAYFFVSSFKGLTKNERYDHASLFVIDDPISSFDIGNRVGIISYLHQQIYNVLKNKYSKVLLFSHDMRTIHDLTLVSEDIYYDLRRDRTDCPQHVDTYLELINKSLRKLDAPLGNLYQSQLSLMYKFAYGAQDDDMQSDETIGNVMRRVMEAYSTFNYGEGFAAMFRDVKVLSLIPNADIREFYRRLGTKFLLNEESHSEDRIRMGELNDEIYSSEEKREMARQLLSFIYLVNPTHIIKVAEGIDLSVLRDWVKDLPISEQLRSKYLSDEDASMNMYDLISKYSRGQYTIEYDDETNSAHCGPVLLSPAALNHIGKTVYLDQITPNTKKYTSKLFMLLGRYSF